MYLFCNVTLGKTDVLQYFLTHVNSPVFKYNAKQMIDTFHFSGIVQHVC